MVIFRHVFLNSCRFMWKDASTWRKASVPVFASTLVNFRHRLVTHSKYFLVIWYGTLSIVHASKFFFSFFFLACTLHLTQTFFKDHMGVPLLMEPNFGDYSCQVMFVLSSVIYPQENYSDFSFRIIFCSLFSVIYSQPQETDY